MTAPPVPAPMPDDAIAAARDAAKAHLRIVSSDEDALVDAEAATALALYEGFAGAVAIARTWRETVAGDGRWQRLAMAPVRAIIEVARLDDDGATAVLAAEAYAIDIDAGGDGWVRGHGGERLAVEYVAGAAESWDELPGPVRQGVVLLIAHLFNARPDSGAPPAAVAALWRPYRRVRLGLELGLGRRRC